MSWLIVVLGFCVLIVLHELGHFIERPRAVNAELTREVCVLVKGSRGSAMDRVVAVLLEGGSKHAA